MTPHKVNMDNDILLFQAQKIIEAEPKVNRFNIFSILRDDNEEVMLHSRFLFELLNPGGSHGYGADFLAEFINVIGFKRDISLPAFEMEQLKDACVYREKVHIDLLLLLPDEYTVIIENKINAEDQDTQIKRYYDEAVQNFRRDQNKLIIIYLTLDGHAPSDRSVAGLKHPVHCISYAHEIDEWLGLCLGRTTMSGVKEVLLQYRALIRRLTNRPDEGGSMELVNLISDSESSFNTAVRIEDALKTAKAQIMLRIMRAIEKELNDAGIDTLFFDHEAIELYYISKEVPAMGFTLKRWQNISLCLIVEIYDSLYYYFGFCRTNPQPKIIPIKEAETESEEIVAAIRKINEMLEPRNQTEYSVFWDYIISPKLGRYYFKKFDDNCISLISNMDQSAKKAMQDILPIVRKVEQRI